MLNIEIDFYQFFEKAAILKVALCPWNFGDMIPSPVKSLQMVAILSRRNEECKNASWRLWLPPLIEFSTFHGSDSRQTNHRI